MERGRDFKSSSLVCERRHCRNNLVSYVFGTGYAMNYDATILKSWNASVTSFSRQSPLCRSNFRHVIATSTSNNSSNSISISSSSSILCRLLSSHMQWLLHQLNRKAMMRTMQPKILAATILPCMRYNNNIRKSFAFISYGLFIYLSDNDVMNSQTNLFCNR